MAKLLGHGDIVVNVLTGCVGQVVERYHPNFHPHYADFRIRFVGDHYRVTRQRHLRPPLLGERRVFAKWNARFLASFALNQEVSSPDKTGGAS